MPGFVPPPFGKSRFTGSDYHEESIIQARKRTADAGLATRVRFEVASAQTFNIVYEVRP